MEKEIPGLKPLWVINFKSTKVDPPLFNDLCRSVQERCGETLEQIHLCQERSLQIQEEIKHLEDTVAQFRALLKKLYGPPFP